MKRYVSLLLLLLTSVSFGQDLHVTEVHAPDTVPFAQPFTIQYQLSHTPGGKVTADPESFSKDFEVQQAQATPASPGTTTYDFTVFPFVLGKSTFTVSFQLNGEKENALQADPLSIQVTPVQTFQDKKLREIRPPFVPAGWITWLLVLLTAAALIYVLYLWKKHLQTQRELRILKRQDNRPSHVIALSQIEALLQSGLWEKHQYKLFYITLIDILREYLQRRFQLDVSADTSAELLARIKNKEALQSFLPLLRSLLTASDLVKFARAVPTEEQRNGHVRLLQLFVQDTIPKPQPAEEAKK